MSQITKTNKEKLSQLVGNGDGLEYNTLYVYIIPLAPQYYFYNKFLINLHFAHDVIVEY